MKSWGGNLSEREIAQAAADLDLDLAFGMVLRKLDELGTANANPPFLTCLQSGNSLILSWPQDHKGWEAGLVKLWHESVV